MESSVFEGKNGNARLKNLGDETIIITAGFVVGKAWPIRAVEYLSKLENVTLDQ